MKIINLLGNEYQGTIGKSVTASKWKGRNYLKKWFKPTNPNSALQQVVRGLMGSAVTLWQAFANVQKGGYYWYQRYRKTNISPFNAMVGSYIAQEKAAADSYTAPPVTIFKVVDDIPLPIEGVKCILRKTGQATDYMTVYSDVAGLFPANCCVEDENYDIFLTKDGYVPRAETNKTAILICVSWEMVEV